MSSQDWRVSKANSVGTHRAQVATTSGQLRTFVAQEPRWEATMRLHVLSQTRMQANLLLFLELTASCIFGATASQSTMGRCIATTTLPMLAPSR